MASAHDEAVDELLNLTPRLISDFMVVLATPMTEEAEEWRKPLLTMLPALRELARSRVPEDSLPEGLEAWTAEQIDLLPLRQQYDYLSVVLGQVKDRLELEDGLLRAEVVGQAQPRPQRQAQDPAAWQPPVLFPVC